MKEKEIKAMLFEVGLNETSEIDYETFHGLLAHTDNSPQSPRSPVNQKGNIEFITEQV